LFNNLTNLYTLWVLSWYVFTMVAISRTINFLPFLLDCLTSLSIFKICECLPWYVFTILANLTTINFLPFLLDCLTSSPIFEVCEFLFGLYSVFLWTPHQSTFLHSCWIVWHSHQSSISVRVCFDLYSQLSDFRSNQLSNIPAGLFDKLTDLQYLWVLVLMCFQWY